MTDRTAIRNRVGAFFIVIATASCWPMTSPQVTSTTTVVASPTSTTTATSLPPASLTTTPETSTTIPSTTTTVLRQGNRAAAVVDLQNRLTGLGYWLGEPNGTFDWNTFHAVIAFQKVADLTRDGVVGPSTYAALTHAVRPTPRSTTGRVVEIDLQRQVMLVAQQGAVRFTFDTSTGSIPGTTPIGKWTVFRQVNGADKSPLGVLYRPKYFHEGVAVHGFSAVPPYAASHGCVRTTNAAMDFIWTSDLMPLGTPVWVY